MTPEVTEAEIKGTIAFLSRTQRSEHAEKRLRFWKWLLEQGQSERSVEGEEVTTEQQQLELEV